MMGTAEQWDHAQSTMEKILKDLDVHYSIGIDEAAFYGPKLDIQYKNVYGKEDTLVTIQIDMLLAERFGMYYIDENGNKALPYIIHRTSLGCYERTLAYLHRGVRRCAAHLDDAGAGAPAAHHRPGRRLLRPAGPAAAARGLPGGGGQPQ